MPSNPFGPVMTTVYPFYHYKPSALLMINNSGEKQNGTYLVDTGRQSLRQAELDRQKSKKERA